MCIDVRDEWSTHESYFGVNPAMRFVRTHGVIPPAPALFEPSFEITGPVVSSSLLFVIETHQRSHVLVSGF